MKLLLILILITSCASRKWYRITCNKHVGGTYVPEEMLMRDLNSIGFSCNKNPANISRITSEQTIEKLEKSWEEAEINSPGFHDEEDVGDFNVYK